MSTTITRVNPDERDRNYNRDYDPDLDPKAERDEPISPVERVLRTAIDAVLHYLPQIAIIIVLIPVLALLSLVAGYIVKSSVPKPWERRVFLQYGETAVPSAYFDLPPLVADQPYDISVHLTVPYTESNLALGNFMTYLTITTPWNETLISGHRPAVVLPQSPRGFVRRLLPLNGTPYTYLSINILSGWIPGTSRVLQGTLEIGRRDSWKSLGKGEGREITVLETFVRGHVQLEGTRKIVGKYPNVAGIMSSASFFITSALGLILCFYRFAAPFENRYARGTGARPAIGLGGGGLGGGRGAFGLPPAVPKILEGRPRPKSQSYSHSHSSTPRRSIKRESSPSASEITTADLPNIPSAESAQLRDPDISVSSQTGAGFTTDEEED